MIDFSDENILLAEIKRDNQEAFGFLFKNYSRRLQGYAYRFIQDQEIVKDIIQECFMKFWEKRDLISSVSITSLLFAMVRNSCLDYLKHLTIVEDYKVEYLASLDGEERLYYADFALDAEYGLLYEELQEQIKIVIDSMPKRCREVFIMSRFNGLKNREIAEKLDISIAGVEKQITKALCIFSKYFKDKYPIEVYITILAWVLSSK